MRTLHIFKPGIRVLGIAESFDPKKDRKSTVAGVVMRKDLVIDGFGFAKTTLGGYDATDRIVRLYRGMKRVDINLLMLSGAVISYYNIIDLESLWKKVQRPVICLTFRESRGIEDSIRKRFGDEAERKLGMYRQLGERKKIKLKTGKYLFARYLGIDEDEVEKVLDDFLIQGRLPEPIRVASLLAAAARKIG